MNGTHKFLNALNTRKHFVPRPSYSPLGANISPSLTGGVGQGCFLVLRELSNSCIPFILVVGGYYYEAQIDANAKAPTKNITKDLVLGTISTDFKFELVMSISRPSS